jgi:hypothetical protein
MKGQSSIQATGKSENASRINEKKSKGMQQKMLSSNQNVMSVNFF